jgi:hypothetical protein
MDKLKESDDTILCIVHIHSVFAMENAASDSFCQAQHQFGGVITSVVQRRVLCLDDIQKYLISSQQFPSTSECHDLLTILFFCATDL